MSGKRNFTSKSMYCCSLKFFVILNCFFSSFNWFFDHTDQDGDKAFRVYKRKCIELLNKEAKEGDGRRKLDNIRAETKQLYSTVLVSLKCTKIISETIKTIRDEELHLQLVELLNG